MWLFTGPSSSALCLKAAKSLMQLKASGRKRFRKTTGGSSSFSWHPTTRAGASRSWSSPGRAVCTQQDVHRAAGRSSLELLGSLQEAGAALHQKHLDKGSSKVMEAREKQEKLLRMEGP